MFFNYSRGSIPLARRIPPLRGEIRIRTESVKPLFFTKVASFSTSKENETDSTVSKKNDKHPSLEQVQSESLTIYNASNETIVRLALDKNATACEELLKRNIMIVDSVEYEEACKTFKEIKLENENAQGYYALPNKIGVVSATTAAFVSFPLVFDTNVVHWFNERFVTADVPEPKDLETWLEVGSWSWNWMEPVLGQLSFFLLCLAFARSQFQTLGILSFTEQIKMERALKLAEKFPKYDSNIIVMFSHCQPFEWKLVSALRRIRGLGSAK